MDRKKERQADRQKGIFTDILIPKVVLLTSTDRWIERKTSRQTDRQKGIFIDIMIPK